jgi:hypothetical protein
VSLAQLKIQPHKTMTETEKAIIASLADVGALVTEIGRTQALMAGFLANHLPNLSADEKQAILAAGKSSQQQMLDLQQKIKTLKAVL